MKFLCAFVSTGSTSVGSGSTATTSITRVHVSWNFVSCTASSFLDAVVPHGVPPMVPLIMSNYSISRQY
jgi:hypothetical protein